MSFNRIWKSGLLASVSGMGVAMTIVAGAPAAAQNATAANPSAPAEVIVTAERRSTNIQATPVAITAVTGASLDQSFITQVAQLSGEVPSLEITRTAGTENLVTIRGVGSETPENTGSTSPGVSAFIDGVYLINSIALNQTLFDIDHIEVLRGPQGDLYGESSTGGAINIVTKAPRLHTYDAQAEVSLGDYDLYRIRAEVNAPIGDTLAIRVSAQRYSHTGFAVDTNPALLGYREDDADDTSEKVSVLWKPTPNFTAQVTGEWYVSDTHGAEQKNINDPDE